MRSPTLLLAALCFTANALACSDEWQREPPTAAESGQPAFQSVLRRPLEWSLHEVLFCAPGTGQLQSLFPLDEPGKRVLVGRSPCAAQGIVEDYQVLDLSSGAPVVVAGVSIEDRGVRTAAHSPAGSGVGFGGRGLTLAIFDGQFRLLPIACPMADCLSLTGIWAASPNEAWLVTGDKRNRVGEARILRFDGSDFTVEHVGGDLWGIWGFGGPNPTIYAVGDRILRRTASGGWSQVLGPNDLPAACTGGGIPLSHVMGVSPMDIWAVGFGGCIVHFNGRTWADMPVPDGASAFRGSWALDAKQILVSGQGGVNLAEGRVALWGSMDGGLSWRQVSDPAFSSLPERGDASFFALSATPGGNRVFAPSIRGTLFVGTPPFNGLVPGAPPRPPDGPPFAPDGGEGRFGRCPDGPDLVVDNETDLRAAVASAPPGSTIAIKGMVTVSFPAVSVQRSDLRITCATEGSGLTADPAAPPGRLIRIHAPRVTVTGLRLDGANVLLEPILVASRVNPPDVVVTVAQDVVMEGNDVTCGPQSCAFFMGTPRALILRNRFAANGPGSGIHLQLGADVPTDGTHVEQNVVFTSAPSTAAAFGGIRVRDGVGTVVADNLVTGPWANSLALTDLGGGEILRNDVRDAVNAGIAFGTGRNDALNDGLVVRNNRVTGAGLVGLMLHFSCRLVITGNNLQGNAGNAGAVFSSETGANTLAGNGTIVVDNGDRDCDGDGVADPNMITAALVRRGAPVGPVIGEAVGGAMGLLR